MVLLVDFPASYIASRAMRSHYTLIYYFMAVSCGSKTQRQKLRINVIQLKRMLIVTTDMWKRNKNDQNANF